jgi:hypothetical protein
MAEDQIRAEAILPVDRCIPNHGFPPPAFLAANALRLKYQATRLAAIVPNPTRLSIGLFITVKTAWVRVIRNRLQSAFA